MFELEDVISMLADDGTHRKQFSYNRGVQKNKSSPTFSVPFDNGLIQHFRDGTGLGLSWGQQHQQYYCFLRESSSIARVEAWEVAQSTRVFLRNLLSSTVAHDTNFHDNQSNKKTECGLLEERAKHHQDAEAISLLVEKSSQLIGDVSYLASCPFIAPIPADKVKAFDLPTILSASIAAVTGKQDIGPNLQLTRKAKSAKDCAIEEKWGAWDAAELDVTCDDFVGKPVILIDDKYQSGMTMHYVARQLLARGASAVHGVVMVKTLRDTDNLDVIDS